MRSLHQSVDASATSGAPPVAGPRGGAASWLPLPRPQVLFGGQAYQWKMSVVAVAGPMAPPMTRTPRLWGKSTAAWPERALLIGAATSAHLPVRGLYTSAESTWVSVSPNVLYPPASSTRLFGMSTMAYSVSLLGTFSLPVVFQFFVRGF